MDLATILGIIVSFVLVIYSIVIGDQGWAALESYVDIPSVAITFGGSFCAVMVQYPLKEFFASFKSFGLALKPPVFDTPQMIQKIIDLSNVARKEGLLSLEEAAGDLDDAFMKKGILLIVDGTDPELVRAILETELISIEGRHKQKIGFWENLASMGPAWGMIGTLIGLVNLLKNMDDPSSIGPAMSVALITTLYGSMLANWVCIPLAGKLKYNNDEEMMQKEIMIEGLLSIQAGENPRVIEEKLKSFIAPSSRNNVGENGGEAVE